MKAKTLIMAGATALCLNACIPSVNPYYTVRDITFDDHLVGEWHSTDGQNEPEHWTFERGENQSYALRVTDAEGKQGQFKATLFKLDGHQFLDLTATQCEYATNQVDLVACSMIPGHLLIHVAQIEPGLKMSLADFDWLQGYLKAHPKALAHHGKSEDDPMVLTADTRDLQRFVLKHLKEDELFSDYGELKRVATDEPGGKNAQP